MIDTSIQRVKISQVIENQLPEFVQSESPLFVDFMKQYYKSQEFQGGTVDIAENIDRYTKLQTFVGAANSAVISGGAYDHTFVTATSNAVKVTGAAAFTPTDATYNANTGDMVLTIAGHPYTTSQTVGIDTGGIIFNCMMDGQATQHAYPRPGDPILGYGVTAITAKDTNTITINVGTSATVGYSVDNATYTPETGEMVLTIPNHGLKGSEDYTGTHAL